MPTIQIQQHPNDPQKASLRFSNGTEYAIDITPPFDDQQEQNLEWYFEEHLKFPFTNKVKFQQIGQSIKNYGENLFKQVFNDPDAYADFKSAISNNDLTIEIIGSSQFHALHWEALKAPKIADPLAVRFNLTRKPISTDTQRQPISNQETPILRVLLVTSRPNGKHDIAYRTISQPLLAAVQNSQLPVQIDLLRPATYQSLIQHLESCAKGTYHILHFDVHGSVLDYASLQKGTATGAYFFDQHYGTTKLEPYNGEKAFLFLDGDDNKAQPIEAADLKVLLARHGIPVVVLNACQSAKQSTQQECLGSLLMQAGIQGVVAMAYSVTVRAATLFVKTLYEELLKHQDFDAATRRARFELHQDKNRKAYHNQVIALEDWLLPVSYQHQPIKLALRAFYQEEKRAWHKNKTKQYQAPRTSYEFVGRDLDVLDIEKRLAKHNLLLIQGMGGAGKTTLLHYLMSWWQVTHFVEQVFYFGYDEKAHTLQQILHKIAPQLLSEDDYTYCFLPDKSIQQSMIVDELRAQRHCLVLDNLESITGAALSIPHSLTANEQAEVKAFLHALIGGHTRVLLGSRGEEAWLQCPAAPYHLAGLDTEAASLLANKILERNNALHYRDGEYQTDFDTLLKLLGGFPLALQVVLANLKQQTPKQVLQALQTGDENIDFVSDDKTQSILRCIDYSHSALSANAQQLLLCLAPFKGFLYLPLLELYSEKLQAQPALANLALSDWQSVLAELQNWGLISPYEVNGFFSLQPTLSYFLNHRLQQNEASLQAIHSAFREVYDGWGNELYRLMESKDPQETQIGQYFTELEYENLSLALQLALTAQVYSFNPYLALSAYINSQQAQEQGLELGERVLQSLENYPPTLLRGQLGAEFVGVIDNIAMRQLSLKHYAEAEQSYRKALSLIDTINGLDKKTLAIMQASVYHQLGYVAQEQRQWQQAHDDYQQALQIKIEFNDRYKQASTYHNLGIVAQEQSQWQQAHDYYQQALQIKIEFNDRYKQASTYHQLGYVAQQQDQWQEAYDYYQQALQIYIEFKDRYQQAGTYHNLGIVAQEQSQWQQAQDYYQQALQIKIEFNDRYAQAETYQNLGAMVHKQSQWQQAQDYYLQALTLFVEFQDEHRRDIILENLNILYHAHADNTLAARISTLLSITEDQALAILQQDLAA